MEVQVVDPQRRPSSAAECRPPDPKWAPCTLMRSGLLLFVSGRSFYCGSSRDEGP